MKSLVLAIRDRYHPLFHLRKFRAFQVLTRYLDVPVAIRIPAIRHKVFVSLSKNLALVLSGGGAGEEQERENFLNVVSVGRFRNFFDIGANVGLYGFMFKDRVQDGSVTMFEPDTANYRLLQKTVDTAGMDSITLMCAAVSDQDGEVTFHSDSLSGATGSIRDDISGGLFVNRHHHHEAPRITVKAVTLDSLVQPGNEPDFIKIDVEGAEMQVLRGARDVIARSHPAIFFECDQGDIPVRNFLVQNGYEVLDFVSMQAVEKLAHNNLALHKVRHADILRQVRRPGRAD